MKTMSDAEVKQYIKDLTNKQHAYQHHKHHLQEIHNECSLLIRSEQLLKQVQ